MKNVKIWENDEIGPGSWLFVVVIVVLCRFIVLIAD